MDRIFRDIPIFSSLNESEISDVMKITREKRFTQGDVIMREGDDGDTMYLVLEGELEVSKTLTMKFEEDDYREGEKILTRYRPDDHAVFGEMALIGRYPRSATISAMSDCRLLEINREDFLKLLEENPVVGARVLIKISESLIARLRQSSRDITRLSTALSVALGK